MFTFNMALRVLLADESSTIKKVMQLALQDFDVEVKAVPIGLDVLEVSRSFQPDIIFADVLLSKRSGYEVASDLKNDPQLKNIPIVLMWSGFMDIDDSKAKQSKADRRLEKPFDADILRSIVKDLVPRLKENIISNYLSFPDLPQIIETPEHPEPAPNSKIETVTKTVTPPKLPPKPSITEPPKSTVTANLSQFQVLDSLSDLDDPDDFQQVPLPGRTPKEDVLLQKKQDPEDWRQGGLEQFRVAPATGAQSEPQIQSIKSSLASPADEADLLKGHVQLHGSTEDYQIQDLDELDLTSKIQPNSNRIGTTNDSSTVSNSFSSLDPMRAEEILREQVRDVLQSIAWKIIPDIAERVVREEIQRLLKEAERFE